MSNVFYNLVWWFGYPIFWVTSSPTALHAQHTLRTGGYILASNHFSPYDVPVLMRHTARHLDFVSVLELFRNPLTAAFFNFMNAFPLDRSRPDSPTVRTILDRLSRGRAVAMFPEGGIRKEARSVVNGGPIRPGIGRLAQLANVPIVPAVVIGSSVYSHLRSWIPLRQTRYGVIYGEALQLREDLEKAEAAIEIEERLRESFVRLYREISTAMSQSLRQPT